MRLLPLIIELFAIRVEYLNPLPNLADVLYKHHNSFAHTTSQVLLVCDWRLQLSFGVHRAYPVHTVSHNGQILL
jgi:hypothetical protein